MNNRFAILVACLSALVVAIPEFAGAAGGGAPIPQIAGTWRGQTQFQVVVNQTTQVVTREVVMTLGEDPAQRRGSNRVLQ